MARIRREETAFPSSPDPRFGGNMARATEGAQYTGSPRDYYGGPSKGSPMHDARYGNYMAPHRVDYTRNAPPQSSGTPNFRGPDRGSGAYLANRFGRGDGGGGLESLESKINLNDMFERFPGMNLWKLIKQLDKRGIEYAENDPFDPRRLEGYDPFNNQIFTDPFDPRRLGIEEEPFDPFNPPGWTDPELNDPFNNQLMADMGGTYDDPYEGLDVLDMEILPGLGYEVGDEYEFDKKRGYDYRIWDNPPRYGASGGLMSLKR